MNVEELRKVVGDVVDSRLVEVTKGYEERLGKLETVEPMTIHSQGNIVDDGTLQEVGNNLYKLPGGSVINAGSLFRPTGKGFHRSDGIFCNMGEETEEYFTKVKEELKRSGSFKAVTKSLSSAVSAAMSVQDDSSAGLYVPEDVRYAMLQFAPPGTIVWPRAQVWPMVTDNINWPKLKQDLTEGSEDFFGGVVLRWTEEGDDKEETKAQFEQLRLICHEISAITQVTDILLEDSAINIGNLLTQLFQGSYWNGTDKQFLNGTGATRPLGVLKDPGVNTQNRVVSGRVFYEDLINMSSKLPPMFDAGAVWMMSKPCFNSLRKQKDDNGQPVIQLGQGYNDFGEGVAGYAIGYPIVMSDYKTATMGSTGDVVLGNWKHYFIGERKTISVEMSRHAAFEKNRTVFRASARVGGIPEEPKAFVVLQSTADASQS